ncbi:FMN-binding negative transcriptional regulator [Bizionia sp. KMM 8389]
MNYPPTIHQDDNKQHLIQVIKTYPLAMLVSVLDNEPIISHLPLIYENNTLIGHIDALNPHSKVLKEQNQVSIVFAGPQCYISPSIYKSKQLPTWNYVRVHLKGLVTEIKDPEAIKESMVRMTDTLEQPNGTYKLEKNDPRMDKFISYVKGFKVTITDWEGKFKLSQNRNTEDFELAKTEMITHNQIHLGQFLDSLLSKD